MLTIPNARWMPARRTLLRGLCLAWFAVAGGSYALSACAADMTGVRADDPRIRDIPFKENQVETITAVYGYVSSVEFAPGERVLKKAMGDSIGWQVRKYRNHVWVKPIEPNARTNLMITTDRHVYTFDLKTSKNPADLTMTLRFRYPDEDDSFDDESEDAPVETAAGSGSVAQPRVVNDAYEAAGDERGFGLQRVFDDGQFTYFLFVGVHEKPGIYAVDANGTEVLINTRREGPYLVAEQMGDRFTVRDGKRTLCIRRALNPANQRMALTGDAR